MTDVRAIVLFGDSKRPWWLRLLRQGFRHVLVMLEVQPRRWLIVNPGSNVTTMRVVDGDWRDAVTEASSDLSEIGALTAAHMTVTRETFPRPMPIRPYTCVEEVKHLLGLRLPWALTPWQLYRHLRAEPAGRVIDAWRARSELSAVWSPTACASKECANLACDRSMLTCRRTRRLTTEIMEWEEADRWASCFVEPVRMAREGHKGLRIWYRGAE